MLTHLLSNVKTSSRGQPIPLSLCVECSRSREPALGAAAIDRPLWLHYRCCDMKYLWPFSAAAALVVLPQFVCTLCTICTTHTHTHTDPSPQASTRIYKYSWSPLDDVCFCSCSSHRKHRRGHLRSSCRHSHRRHYPDTAHTCLFPVRRWRVLTSPFLSSFSFSSSTALGCRNTALHFFLLFFSFFSKTRFCANAALQHFVISSKDDQITHTPDLATKKEKAFFRSAAAASKSILQTFLEIMVFSTVCRSGHWS